jgi:hypothetical protein
MVVKIGRDSMVVRSAEILTALAGEDLMMMSLERGTYYGLDAVGAEIWELMRDPISVGDICAVLQSRYEVSGDQCLHDVLALLGELSTEGLLHVTGQEPRTSSSPR